MSPDAGIAALVPVRGLASGKCRLASVLSGPERRSLVEAMLVDVLEALQATPAIGLLAVVSADPAISPLTRFAAATLLPDPPGGGLNASLHAALAWLAAAAPGRAALVVAADLPTLTPELLAGHVLAARKEVVIARSKDGGTNLLLLRSPLGQKLCFGPESAARHHAAAEARGQSVAVIEHPVLAHDLDTPEDLASILPLLPQGRTRRLLGRLRAAESASSRGQP